QALHAAHVVEVRVREEHGARPGGVVPLVEAQCLVAAVDHEQRLAVALQHHAGRAELGRLRAAHAHETEGIAAQRAAPDATGEDSACCSSTARACAATSVD